MYELPTSMNIRFWFYLNFLSIFVTVVTYVLMIAGVAGIILGIYKIVSYQTKGSLLPNQISDIKNHNLQFITNRRLSCKSNEIDNTLLVSNDENAMSHVTTELLNLKEEIVWPIVRDSSFRERLFSTF